MPKEARSPTLRKLPLKVRRVQGVNTRPARPPRLHPQQHGAYRDGPHPVKADRPLVEVSVGAAVEESIITTAEHIYGTRRHPTARRDRGGELCGRLSDGLSHPPCSAPVWTLQEITGVPCLAS